MASLSIPNSFTNNTVASATEVNANFTSVKSFAESAVVQIDGSVQAPTIAIADGAITSAKILDGTIINGDINASAAIAYSKLALSNSIVATDIVDGAITTDKILNGTIMDVDINASAAIALSKLATGALPTAITIASANIVDGTIVAGDIANGAVDKAKIGSGPRGIVAYVSSTTSDTTITTTSEIQLTCPSFTAVAGRYYRITYYEPLLIIPVGAHIQGSISGFEQPIIETALIQNPRTSGDHYQFMNLSLVTTLPAGTFTMRGILSTNSGTGQATRTSEKPAWLCVEDIGTL